MSRTKKIWNIALLLLSMAFTVLMCCLTTPQDTTISAIQVRQPILGVLWALFTALATLFNMEYLRKKNGIANRCFQIFLWIGAIAALLTPFTLDESPIGFTLPFVNLHRLSAIVFAVVTYVAMITVLIAKRKTYGRIYTILAAVLLVVGFFNVYGIFAMSAFISALMETCLILVGLTVLLLANYVVPEAPMDTSSADRKQPRRITAASICVAVLVLLVCGITTIPSYRVQVSDEVFAARVIPEAGYTEVETDYLSVYLPDAWQERRYNDLAAYYDDVDRNSASVLYENPKDLDSLPRFSIIQNANVTSAKLITYMGHTMLAMERQENGCFLYTYVFNTEERSVTLTLTFTSTAADVHETIFRSLLIHDAPEQDAA